MTDFGKDYRPQFSADGSADSYVPINGDKTLDWNRASNDIDTSDKGGPSGVFVPGRLTFAVSGTTKLPDPTFKLVYDACKAGTVLSVQVQKGAVIKYDGKVTCGNWKSSFPSDGVATYSFDMSEYDTPTTDDLSASA